VKERLTDLAGKGNLYACCAIFRSYYQAPDIRL
jgi:hypothetical protein